MINTAKSWVRVCALNDIPADKAQDVTINGQRLIVTRCGDEPRIYQGFCSHMLYPLGNSGIDNCVLTCSLHRSQFDVRDGSVVTWSTYPPTVGKTLSALRERKALKSYETRVTDGDVYIAWLTDRPENVRVRMGA